MKGMSTTQIMRVKTVKLSTTHREKKEQEIKEKIYILFSFSGRYLGLTYTHQNCISCGLIMIGFLSSDQMFIHAGVLSIIWSESLDSFV
jgi:hypothetical protein